MNNISGFGLSLLIKASNTFPNGFIATAFADDADAADFPDYTLADTGMGLNGHFLVWSKPSGIEVSVNIVPTTQDDVNFSILSESNRVGLGKAGARDVITMVATYPNGLIITLNKGVIITGSLLPSVSNAGRIKSRKYNFRFENVNKSGEVSQTV